MYGIKETSKGVFEKFDTDDSNSNKVTLDKESMSVSGDDFAIEDIEEDDAYLVTVADGEIQTLVEAEVIEDTEIASFKVGSNVTVDGTKYSFAETAEFDAETLAAYGNASSIYLTASLKKVVTNDGAHAVIAGVDNVTTGVKNASIETWSETEAQNEVDKKVNTWTDTSYGVYTLFKDNGYVIAAVVVGEDAASTKNLVYAHTKNVELESYDKTEDEWTWTRKVIFEGEEITLTEKSDALSELNKMSKGNWYQVKYNAEGNVISVELASSALANDQYKYITYFSQIEDAVEEEDTVLLDKHNITNELTLKGSTLYDNTDGIRGLAIDDDTKIVLIQTNNNKETTTFETGVKALEDALDDLNVDSTTKKVNFDIGAIIEDGMATVVVLYDRVVDGYTENDKPGNTDLKVTVANGVITVKGPAADVDDVAGAIVDALTAAGYKDIKVPVKSGDIDRTVGIKGTKNSIEYAFEYVRDFNA